MQNEIIGAAVRLWAGGVAVAGGAGLAIGALNIYTGDLELNLMTGVLGAVGIIAVAQFATFAMTGHGIGGKR